MAQPGLARASCEAFAQQFSYAGLHIVASKPVAAGTLKVPGIAETMPEHCVIEGRLNECIGVGTRPGAVVAVGAESVVLDD